MTKLITKDELIKQLATETARAGSAIEKERNMRREFAKAFNWKEMKSPYNSEQEYRTPSWPEIFVELGRIMSYDERKQKDDKIYELRQIVEEYRIKEEKNENK